MGLRILPANIANLIAAGEVVQRPASVVKELVENAIDAGASKIDVIISDAGRTLIRVIDNGCGMTPEDALLCFERHATSKIATAEDISHILTFGFRGEALASIAAVAEVTLKTRREEGEVGCEVVMSGSEHISTLECATPKGSNFAVRNLFFNTPARRKFLKSDNIEFKHIVEEFIRIALTRPEVSFSLSHNGKEIYVLKAAASLKFRISDIFGTAVAQELVDVSGESSFLKISGFAGRPETAKKTPGNQYFFVNGRCFRSAYLHKAVQKAYSEMIPEGFAPAYFIYLELDPHKVDVNIHPTKMEIKFEDDSLVFQILAASLRSSLGRNAIAGSLEFDNPEAVKMPVIGRSFEEYSADNAAAQSSYNPFSSGMYSPFSSADNYSPFDSSTPSDEKKSFEDSSKYVSKPQNYGALFEEQTVSMSKFLTVKGKYILTQSKSGLLIVNVRRARERVFYEKFLDAIEKNSHAAQIALFPVQIRIGVENRLLFDENSQMLATMGFDIAPFGNDTIVVNGVPEGFPTDSARVQALMSDVLLILNEDKNGLKDLVNGRQAERFASLAASNGPEIASAAEAGALMDALMSSTNPEFTPSGKRISVVMELEEIDKKF